MKIIKLARSDSEGRAILLCQNQLILPQVFKIAARVFYLLKVLEFKIDAILADLFEWKSNTGEPGLLENQTEPP